MTKIFFFLALILCSNMLMADTGLQSATSPTPCFNMKEAGRIGKQVNELLKHEFCEDKVAPSNFIALSQNILSSIMTKSFLGIAPPENWKLVTDDIIKNCIATNDLCKKEARNEFQVCIKSRIPLIFIQFGPWLADNCPQLNKSLIEQWPNKQEILQKIITESKAQINPV